MSQFDELLAALNAEQEEQSALAKALPAADDGEDDDAAIQAAAADGADADDDEDPEDPDDTIDEDDDEPLTKSMILEDGTEVHVVDADAMIKSMTALGKRVASAEVNLTKALESMVATVKAQGELIKALTAKTEKLSSQGAGRKAVLTVHEHQTTLAKSDQPDELSVKEVMAKANAAFAEGKINGLELTTIDVALRSGSKVNPNILAKALS